MTGLDPVLAHVAAAAATGPGTFDGTPAEARERLASAILAAPDTASREAVGSIEDRVVRHDGHDVSVRIVRPRDVADLVAVFVHGGGYVLGSAALSDDIACRLSAELKAVVVNVDYRLAPEHPFPAALDDVVAAIGWAAADIEELAPSARLVVVGESAGANLVAAATLITDAGVVAQALVVPSPDLAAIDGIEDIDGSMLTVADLQEIDRLAFGGDAAVAGRFPASALASDHLETAPATVVALAGFDPTAATGRRFADALTAAGVDVHVLDLAAMFHPFLGFAHVSPGASTAFISIVTCLRETVARTGTLTSHDPTSTSED